MDKQPDRPVRIWKIEEDYKPTRPNRHIQNTLTKNSRVPILLKGT